MSIGILTDSVSDIKAPLATQLGVKVVPLYVNFRGQVLKDELEIRTLDLFKGIAEGAAMPSTSQPTPADFEQAYRELLANFDQILVITISSKLSGTMQSAVLAAQGFPGKITVFDSLSASGSQAMMVERAVRLAKQGANIPDIVSTLEKVRARMMLRFSVATLDYLKKNGRIGGAQALLGGLLNIKPILGLNEGRVESVGRERGAQKALAHVIDELKDYVARNGKCRAVYLYTDKPDDVTALRDAGRGLGIEEFGVFQVGPVIAAHVGPGTYGALIEPVEV
jgi:DegV family protein with EDD domain